MIVDKKVAFCNYYKREIAADPIKKNGTSSLNNHLRACRKYSPIMDKTQALLSLQSRKGKEEESKGALSNWKVAVNVTRVVLSLCDELVTHIDIGVEKRIAYICKKPTTYQP
ncbi:hypothetical protein Droror1_Dr00020155 [Drosera rotundifolia]